MDRLFQDLRYALRTLRRGPAFTATAVVILALGIGATTSMFSLLHATLFRQLPFPEPDRLVALHLTQEWAGEEIRRTRWSYPEFQALRETVPAFQAVAVFGAAGFNLTGAREPERVRGEVVSAAYFRVLDVDAALGRTFVPEDDRPSGAEPVAILSHELWASRFGAEEGLIGGTVRVSGVPLTVVGIMPAGFQGLTGPVDLWVPQATAALVYYPEQLTTHQHFQSAVGRLRGGTSLSAAAAALEAMEPVLRERWGGEHEGDAVWGASLSPLDAARVDPEVRQARLVLFGAVLLLLLIAGADLAGLLLGRGLSRRRELAVRMALGSSRGRLIRQVLTESTVLALLGGGAGFLVAVWVTGLAGSLVPTGYTGAGFGRLHQFASVSVDGWVLAFALGVSLLVGLAFGLGPALRATRPGADLSLRSEGEAGPGERGAGWVPSGFSLLVVGEFALALTLLVGAGLLVETLSNLRARDATFDADGVLTFRISPSLSRYSAEDGPALLEAVLERVSAVPGVRYASVDRCVPLSSCSSRFVRLPPEEDPGGGWTLARRHYVAPEHFRALGIELLRGRPLSPTDRPGSPNAVVVNRTLAETLWPGEDPVGRRLVFQGADLNFIGTDSAATVVGVVEDVPYGGPAEPAGLDLYTSFRQFSWPSTEVIVRAEGVPSGALVPALRRALLEVDPDLPIHDVATLEERLGQALAGPRFNGGLLATFAALALVLAAVGIYGVMSQYVGRRTREMGIRQAVGAEASDVLGLVVRRGLALAGSGLVVGAAGGLALTRLLASQLYGVSPTDPHIFLGAAAFLAAAALVAVFLPARRASRVDPAVALKGE